MTARRLTGSLAIAATTAIVTAVIAPIPGLDTLWRRTVDHVASRRAEATARFAAQSGLVAGDPVLRATTDQFALIGHVRAVATDDSGGEVVTLVLDPEALRLAGNPTIEPMHPGSNLRWALKTLAPPAVRERVQRELQALFEKESAGFVAELGTPLREGLERLFRAFVDRSAVIVPRERALWEPLLLRLRDELLDAELGPVLDARVWPRVEVELGRSAAGVANEIVGAIGFRVLVRAVWARTKDAVGVGAETAFQEELERVLREAAIPVIKRRAPELLDSLLVAARESWSDPEVRDALDRVVRKALDDPELARVAAALWKAVVVDDEIFRAELDVVISDPRLRAPLTRLAAAAEPIFESAIREALLRDDGQGLDFTLTQVLRNVLLTKDRRYALFVEGGGDGPAAARIRPR